MTDTSCSHGPPRQPRVGSGKSPAGGVHAGVAGQRQRGGDHGQAAGGPGHGVHACPSRRACAASGRVTDDHGQVGDPGQPDEAVVRLSGVGGQHDQLVGQREPEGGRPRARHRLAAFPQLPGSSAVTRCDVPSSP